MNINKYLTVLLDFGSHKRGIHMVFGEDQTMKLSKTISRVIKLLMAELSCRCIWYTVLY